jgi:hypothetical protein
LLLTRDSNGVRIPYRVQTIGILAHRKPKGCGGNAVTLEAPASMLGAWPAQIGVRRA